MNTTKLGAFAPLLVLSLAFGAQEGATGKPQDPRLKQGESAGMAGKQMPVAHGVHLIDAKKIVGTKVVNTQGEDLGKVEDLVIDQTGRVQYAVLSFGGFLGMGDKLFALPWQCIDTQPAGLMGNKAPGLDEGRDHPVGDKDPERDKTAGRGEAQERRMAADRIDKLVLNVDKERLKNAPGFDKDAWPTMANMQWCQEVDTYFAEDVRRTGRPVEASARVGGVGSAVVRIGDLRGHDIVSQQGEDVGEVERVVIDTQSGRTSFVVVSAGGFLGMGDDKVALPFEALRLAPERTQGGETGQAGRVEEFKLTLNVDAQKLKSAPKFQEEGAYNAAYVSSLYRHYGLQQPMGADRGMGKDPMRKDDPLRKDDPTKRNDPPRQDG